MKYSIKVDVSLRFVSWLDILTVPESATSYILFKLKEKERDEAVSLREYILRLFRHRLALIPHHFSIKLIA